jgi:hypothetical protein
MNDFGTCLFANGSVCAGTGNPDVGANSATGFANGAPHIMTFKRTKSTGLVSLYLDGNLAGTTTGGTQSLTSPNQLVIGAQQTLNNYFSGDIAEVQIYNSPLADSDRLALEKTLKCKYGITGGAVPTAPTGLTGLAGNRQISLNWVLTTGATSYNLWNSTNGGASYQLTASGLTTSNYVDTNAANGLTNYYKLTATDGCGAGAYSATVAVFLPVPNLGISLNSNTLAISWPGWAGGWGLYAATNLTPPVVWQPVTNALGSNNNSFNVNLPLSPGNQFFRLSNP